MQIETRTEGDIAILAVSGEFDATEVPRAEQRVDELVRDFRTRLVVDLSGLRWIDSSAIGWLLRTHNRLRPLEGEQVLASPEGLVLSTIKTLGLDQSMRIFPDAAEACRYLAGEAARIAEFDGVPVDETRFGRTRLEFELLARPGRGGVAKMLVPYGDGASFKYPIDPETATVEPHELEPGCELRVRFRQPFLDPGRVFEAQGVISLAIPLEDDPHGASKYMLKFTEIDEEDRRILERFARDQDDYRRYGRPPG